MPQKLPRVKIIKAKVATNFKGNHMARHRRQIQKDKSKVDIVSSDETKNEEHGRSKRVGQDGYL